MLRDQIWNGLAKIAILAVVIMLGCRLVQHFTPVAAPQITPQAIQAQPDRDQPRKEGNCYVHSTQHGDVKVCG